MKYLGAISDNEDQVTKEYVDNRSGVTGVKGNAENSYRTGNVNITADNVSALAVGSPLFTTNPFVRANNGAGSLYISKIDNALYAADKRFNVSLKIGGVTTSSSGIFNGSYEDGVDVTNGQTAVLTFDFSNLSGSKFPGYPYGYIYVSFYHVCKPSSITGRAYNNYSSQGSGWHDLSFERIYGDADSHFTYRARQSYYGLQTLEITIVGDTTNSYGYTRVTEVEMWLDRPDSSRTPFLSKYNPETLYYNLTAPAFIGDLQGTASNASKVNNLTVQTAVPANAVFTDTKVTAVGNHYTPSGGTTTSASGATGTSGTTVQVVTGVTKDAAGHVTGITSGAATDTTYESKAAASGGTAVSLVTTGEKYTWNNKQNALTNPVTGTGTSGYLTKWNGTGTVTSGPQLGTSTTTFLNNKGEWATPAGTGVPTTRKVNGHALSSDVTVTKSDVGLGSVTDGAEINQNAFSNMKAGSVTVSAAAKTDTFEFVAGNNISLLADTYDKTLTISATGGGTPVSYTQGDSQDLQDGLLTDAMVWSAKDLHDYPLTVASAKNHTHGKITNAGDCTTNSTIASGDRIMINDESAGYIANSSITFGSSTSTFLANNGTWQTPANNATAIANASTIFVETEITLINNAAIAAGGVTDSTATGTKSGYYPIAISGFYSSTRYFCTTQCCISARSSGSVTVDYMVYNPSSSSRTGTVTARVLWVKLS